MLASTFLLAESSSLVASPNIPWCLNVSLLHILNISNFCLVMWCPYKNHVKKSMVHGSPVWLGSAGSAFQRLGQRADPLLGSEDCLRHSRGTMQSETRLKKPYSNVNMLIWNVPSSNSTWFNVWFSRRYQFFRRLGKGLVVVVLPLAYNHPESWRSICQKWGPHHLCIYIYIYISIYGALSLSIYIYIWRFVKMSVPGFVDKSQFHACRLMLAFKKHDLPWWRENVEILRYLWKSF